MDFKVGDFVTTKDRANYSTFAKGNFLGVIVQADASRAVTIKTLYCFSEPHLVGAPFRFFSKHLQHIQLSDLEKVVYGA